MIETVIQPVSMIQRDRTSTGMSAISLPFIEDYTVNWDGFSKHVARTWEAVTFGFYEFNDRLQYLGYLIFRSSAPIYNHSAAQFLKLREWILSNQTHPDILTRPDSDIASRLGILEGE